MNRRQAHEFIKNIVVERLRVPGRVSAVISEVELRDSRARVGRPDVVIVNDLFGREIIIIEIKVYRDEVGTEFLEQVKTLALYAHEVYICLPQNEYSDGLASLCRANGVGLVLVNLEESEGPVGTLDKKVQSPWNAQPKQWTDLRERLEKLGVHPSLFT